ncbi:MAG: aldehyde dehydrogenase (NADP(+)) [Fimbriimonadaceae bacterium]|nr:aldehyde dehydrogenase (NADP(+)) [Fimbriimonadaceae bacterium]
MVLTGNQLVGFAESSEGERTLRGFNPASGSHLDPAFSLAVTSEVERALTLADRAAETYGRVSQADRAAFLDRVADAIDALGDGLIGRCAEETALPTARLVGERARTTGQLRLFANLLREGSWPEAVIDLAQPDRKPAPKPDLRRILVPLGPVVVFGASNFPLAFSVAGGDTASALAAGCPVVFKAHPAHPGTSEMVGRAVIEACRESDMPEGTFSLLHTDVTTAQRLVTHPMTQAVAFTGSQAVGRALMRLAADRDNPVPVYAEMGSVNPVFLVPGFGVRMPDVAKGYAASLAQGVGQFCTNPGVVVGVVSEELERFVVETAAALAAVAPGTMLTAGIADAYQAGTHRLAGHPDVKTVFSGTQGTGQAAPSLFTTRAETFLSDNTLGEEVFGPAGLVVVCDTFDQMKRVARNLEGQLTATLQTAGTVTDEVRELLPLLVRKAGRVVHNGFPTGVEVCPAMQHGGPFPSSSNARTTSVGTAAVLRFVRPVCFQDMPAELLPEELHDRNPLHIWRKVDGRLTHDPVRIPGVHGT